MSGDGAHLGLSADRALSIILGGEPPPSPGEALPDREAIRTWIMDGAPDPLAESGPCAGLEASHYGDAANTIAKAMVLLLGEQPTLATLGAWALYEALEKRWPGFDAWIGGPTGFMVGWAHNTARWLYGMPPAPNPAIVTIGVGATEPPVGGDA